MLEVILAINLNKACYFTLLNAIDHERKQKNMLKSIDLKCQKNNLHESDPTFEVAKRKTKIIFKPGRLRCNLVKYDLYFLHERLHIWILGFGW